MFCKQIKKTHHDEVQQQNANRHFPFNTGFLYHFKATHSIWIFKRVLTLLNAFELHSSCCLAHPSSFIYLMRKLSTLFLHVISFAIFSFKFFFCSDWLERNKTAKNQHECLLEKPQLKCTLWFTTTINWNCVFFLLYFFVTIFFRAFVCLFFSSSKWFFSEQMNPRVSIAF